MFVLKCASLKLDTNGPIFRSADSMPSAISSIRKLAYSHPLNCMENYT